MAGGILDAFDAKLPFTLTDGQQKVSREIFDDLATEHPMHRLLQGEVGSGKAQPLDALVLTPRGFRPMGEMTVGTEVVVPSGELAVVDGVFPQGEREVWRLVLSDGSAVECDDEHLWIVGARGTGEQVRTTRELRGDLLEADGRPKWSIAAATPVDLEGGETAARSLRGGRALADGSGGRPADRVPSAYRNAPLKDRLAVVQGLMDAGGQPAGDAAVYRSAAGPQAGDLAWLVRSLGAAPSSIPYRTACMTSPWRCRPRIRPSATRSPNLR